MTSLSNNNYRSPLEFISLLHEDVYSLNKADIPKSKKLEKMGALMKENIDFQTVVKFVLGNKIKLLSPEEVQSFTKYYEDTVSKKYAKLLTTELKSYKATRQEDLSKERYLVHTILEKDGSSAGSTLKIAYLIIGKNSDYKIIDAIISGGISMAMADREEIATFLERNTLRQFKKKFMED
ncbi:ABC transporter substrate-binding protein [Neorickettsia helminthoeca]|uniref:ABC transporter substrate-binding protein n=1 Tax=Neorickettsia helminthoeca TaxID=33994 RepID=UPI00068762BD|nr:ABC transporter substrate-binding protein [Neorickettsia helminthoeca]